MQVWPPEKWKIKYKWKAMQRIYFGVLRHDSPIWSFIPGEVSAKSNGQTHSYKSNSIRKNLFLVLCKTLFLKADQNQMAPIIYEILQTWYNTSPWSRHRRAQTCRGFSPCGQSLGSIVVVIDRWRRGEQVGGTLGWHCADAVCLM